MVSDRYLLRVESKLNETTSRVAFSGTVPFLSKDGTVNSLYSEDRVKDFYMDLLLACHSPSFVELSHGLLRLPKEVASLTDIHRGFTQDRLKVSIVKVKMEGLKPIESALGHVVIDVSEGHEFTENPNVTKVDIVECIGFGADSICGTSAGDKGKITRTQYVEFLRVVKECVKERVGQCFVRCYNLPYEVGSSLVSLDGKDAFEYISSNCVSWDA